MGANTTVMLQLEPLLRDAGQLLVWVNPALTAIPEIVSAAGPFAVNFTLLFPDPFPTNALPNAILVGDNVGALSTPLPDSDTDNGTPEFALLEIVSAPVRLPVAEGVKLTLMEQLAPGPSEEGQLLVCEKSPVT